jgi:hypothetical protein
MAASAAAAQSVGCGKMDDRVNVMNEKKFWFPMLNKHSIIEANKRKFSKGLFYVTGYVLKLTEEIWITVTSAVLSVYIMKYIFHVVGS